MRLGVPHLWLTYKHYIFNEVWKIDHAVKYIVHYGARIQCVCCFVSFLCQSIGEVLPPFTLQTIVLLLFTSSIF
jgi:hypothetical protein